jgi:hypothetical protein
MRLVVPSASIFEQRQACLPSLELPLPTPRLDFRVTEGLLKIIFLSCTYGFTRAGRS